MGLFVQVPHSLGSPIFIHTLPLSPAGEITGQKVFPGIGLCVWVEGSSGLKSNCSSYLLLCIPNCDLGFNVMLELLNRKSGFCNTVCPKPWSINSTGLEIEARHMHGFQDSCCLPWIKQGVANFYSNMFKKGENRLYIIFINTLSVMLLNCALSFIQLKS